MGVLNGIGVLINKNRFRALIEKGTLIGRRVLNRTITVPACLFSVYLLHVCMVLLKSQTYISNQLSGDTDSNLFKRKRGKLNEYVSLCLCVWRGEGRGWSHARKKLWQSDIALKQQHNNHGNKPEKERWIKYWQGQCLLLKMQNLHSHLKIRLGAYMYITPLRGPQ